MDAKALNPEEKTPSLLRLITLRQRSQLRTWKIESNAAIAQLAARGSHNPKVVSSILTGRKPLSSPVSSTQRKGKHQGNATKTLSLHSRLKA